MYNGSITDVSGLTVGHAQDEAARTGCSVVLFGQGAVAGVSVRGAAPGTRETDLLRSECTVEHIHAIVLTGGSAFGLDAASGVMRYLEENDIGFDTGIVRVPIVCAAVLFDLGVGSALVRPDDAMGYAAARAASASAAARGYVGAGCGATVGKALGQENAMDGGLGMASVTLPGGVVVAAIIAVNAMGDVVGEDGRIIAGARRRDGDFADTMALLTGATAPQGKEGTNTSIGVVATNAALTKAQANRLADTAHDGLARAIRPVHTAMDGDTLFAVSTGDIACDSSMLGAAAALVVERAVRDAVHHCSKKGNET